MSPQTDAHTDCYLTKYGKRVANDLADHQERYGQPGPKGPPEARRAGLEVVASGDHRTVYAPENPQDDDVWHGDDVCVLKVAHHGYTSQNENEVVTWSIAPPEVREVLVPVVEYAGDASWLTMPRVRLGIEPGAEDKILDQLSGVDWTCEDIHAANIARYRGGYALLDYGFKCYPKSSEHGEPIYDIRRDVFESDDPIDPVRLVAEEVFD